MSESERQRVRDSERQRNRETAGEKRERQKREYLYEVVRLDRIHSHLPPTTIR
eukprot:COSAG03_NODE_2327_length_2882_cov_19.795544_3_plen_53_part_00